MSVDLIYCVTVFRLFSGVLITDLLILSEPRFLFCKFFDFHHRTVNLVRSQ